jgi:hypothetical protein
MSMPICSPRPASPQGRRCGPMTGGSTKSLISWDWQCHRRRARTDAVRTRLAPPRRRRMITEQ